ncbi:Retrotransposon-derived protein peg10 [Entomophthora muscae]|uniref:Retrotransposon-derived protein peg10 n=1 Tax=Entomophthora muscae TaxID=34485 RepID=A0ACC2UC89_9FUNG|nr:Retrotransposon-derived protein peg10 [Entomophthora muscae]
MPCTPYLVSLYYYLVFLLGWLYDKEDHTPTTYTNQTVVPNTLAHSSPPPSVFNTLAYAQAHFTAYGSEFFTNSQKVLYLAKKLTGHYRDWFSSHLICNPGILQNYDPFVSSLLSFSGEDKESSTPSVSWFAGLTQGSLPLGKYNQKFCSLQSRLQASDSEACSFYKIGLNRLLHTILVHYNLPKELEPLIREVVKWNQKYLSLKTHSPSNLTPTVWSFIPDKGSFSPTPPPGTKPKSGGGFCLTAEEVLRRRNNNICYYYGSKDHLLPACPLSKRPPFANKISSLAFLSLNNTSKSSTVLVTINGPLGKIKVLALLDTGADANFIEEKLAKPLGLPAFGSLDVKVGNSTLIGTTPILQPVTIDLEGSPFCVTCNSSPNLSFLFILGFPWLRESLLNFDHPNNKISFTCNDVIKSLSLVPGTLGFTPPKPNLIAISSTIPDTLSSKDKNGLPYC